MTTKTRSILTQPILDAIRSKNLDAVVLRMLVENEIIETLMEAYRYNQSQAAKAYGKSRGSFRTLLKDRFGNKYLEKNKVSNA